MALDKSTCLTEVLVILNPAKMQYERKHYLLIFLKIEEQPAPVFDFDHYQPYTFSVTRCQPGCLCDHFVAGFCSFLIMQYRHPFIIFRIIYLYVRWRTSIFIYTILGSTSVFVITKIITDV